MVFLKIELDKMLKIYAFRPEYSLEFLNVPYCIFFFKLVSRMNKAILFF